jgi:hypothetical protein
VKAATPVTGWIASSIKNGQEYDLEIVTIIKK